MNAVLTVADADVSGVTHYDVSVEVGRDDVDTQPDASVFTALLDGWQPAGQLSDPVRLADDTGQLFAGRLTDIETTLEPDLDPPWRTRITAVGPHSDLGRVYVGDEPWPQETDSRRIVRVLTLAGVNTAAINPDLIGPDILPADVDRRTALDVAQAVAADAFGVFWEQPSDPVTPIRYSPQRLRVWNPVALTWSEFPSTLTWATADPSLTWDDLHSSILDMAGAPVHLDLDAGNVVAELVLQQTISDLIRRVRVTWGPEVEGGSRAQAIVGGEPPDDTPEVTRDTQLADAADAFALADTIWRSHREPAWQMRQVTLKPFEDMPPGDAVTIRAALAVGTRITLTGIAFDSPIGTTWEGYLEGWRHDLVDGSHTVTMNVSQRILSEPADRWRDIDAALIWRDVDATVTWDQTGDMP